MGRAAWRRWVWLATSLLAVLCCTRASAQLSVAKLEASVDLAPHVALLRDPSAALTLQDVRSRSFVAHDGSPLSFGVDEAALWLRVRVDNDSGAPVAWVLEVAEPTLEHLALNVVHGDGRIESFPGGTEHPFASRAVQHPNFVYELTSPPHDRAELYVRAKSFALRTPLRAWAPAAYASHHEIDTILRAMCLGALLLVALYHLGILSLVRHVEHAWYALASLSLALVLMSLSGQLAQLLLPNHPQLVMQSPPLTIALGMVTIAFFTYAATEQLKNQAELSRLLLKVCYATLPLLVGAALAPVALALRFELGILLLVTLAGPYLLYVVSGRGIPEMRRYTIGWYSLILSIPITILRYAGIWPDNGLTEWVLPVGFVAYGVANSLALAAMAGRLRIEVGAMNVRLMENVHQLERALLRAEEASEAAQHATKKAQSATQAKDEFMATMSHELRTPLNAIINIPQGLIGQFASVRNATCSACKTVFLLDDGESVGAQTRCEECGRLGSLVEGSGVRFQGDDARCLYYLQKIERSGQHLLQMVNGVLDYSKLEAGRFELALGPVELEDLVREVIEQMVEIAQRKNVLLEVLAPSRPDEPMVADPLRLKQVLINLLANAIKFSPAGTTVTLRWENASDAVRIAVEDRGIGIAAEDHGRIFTSFEQVHKGDTRKYGGTGLGLSISRSLVRMHGGELSVRSELGKGSTFEVYLPRLPALPGALEEGPTAENTNGSLESRTITCVDA